MLTSESATRTRYSSLRSASPQCIRTPTALRTLTTVCGSCCPVCSAMDCTVGTRQVSRVMPLLGISYKCIKTRPPTWELLKLVRVRVSVRGDVNRIQARRRLSLETCGCFGTASWDGESFPWCERSLHVQDDMLKGETLHVVIVCNDVWHRRSGVFLRYAGRFILLTYMYELCYQRQENKGQ